MYLYQRDKPFSKRDRAVNCADETRFNIVVTEVTYVVLLSRLNDADCAFTLLLHIMRGKPDLMWVPISVRTQNDVWACGQFLICWCTGVGVYDGAECLKGNCYVVGGRLYCKPIGRERGYPAHPCQMHVTGLD